MMASFDVCCPYKEQPVLHNLPLPDEGSFVSRNMLFFSFIAMFT